MEPIEKINHDGYTIEIWIDEFQDDPRNHFDDCPDYVLTAWQHGDVYGWVVPELDESCWGYYGHDDYDYMISEAKSAIDCWFKTQKEFHFHNLKEMIKNHVPLTHRRTLQMVIN